MGAAPRGRGRMFSVMSRRKLALIAMASSGDSGGHRRVFTRPGRGALAITAIAQRRDRSAVMIQGRALVIARETAGRPWRFIGTAQMNSSPDAGWRIGGRVIQRGCPNPSGTRHARHERPAFAARRTLRRRQRARGDQLNATLAVLLGHRSVRSYLPTTLPPGALETIVAAAQSAASSSNLQVWSVVAVEDQARKERLAALAGNQSHIAACPTFLVFVADLARVGMLAEAQGTVADGANYLESFIVGVVDASLAAQNAVVALESMGLGSVYIGGMRNHPEEVAEELGLPARVMAVFGLCVGYPDPAVRTDIKPRLPQEAVLHRERYDTAPLADAAARYDLAMDGFQALQALRPAAWTRTVVNRLRGAASLSGRDRMRAALAALGFELR